MLPPPNLVDRKVLLQIYSWQHSYRRALFAVCAASAGGSCSSLAAMPSQASLLTPSTPSSQIASIGPWSRCVTALHAPHSPYRPVRPLADASRRCGGKMREARVPSWRGRWVSQLTVVACRRPGRSSRSAVADRQLEGEFSWPRTSVPRASARAAGCAGSGLDLGESTGTGCGFIMSMFLIATSSYDQVQHHPRRLRLDRWY